MNPIHPIGLGRVVMVLVILGDSDLCGSNLSTASVQPIRPKKSIKLRLETNLTWTECWVLSRGKSSQRAHLELIKSGNSCRSEDIAPSSPWALQNLALQSADTESNYIGSAKYATNLGNNGPSRVHVSTRIGYDIVCCTVSARATQLPPQQEWGFGFADRLPSHGRL